MPADLVTRLLLQNREFDSNLKASQMQIQSFKKGVNGMGASVKAFVGGFAGMAGVSLAFMDAAQKSMEFEKALSSLRSLTGVSAKELDFFKQEAIKMGSTTMQSASQVVDAFKLIGSQKPELLKNKAALAEVTNQAIILAEAAEMDVPEAATALTGSLNQMGVSADKASEYINILAAASQAGSADIPYLTKAIEKSGGAASSVGIKYNELVAAIEAIAPKVTVASEAGTSLRNIFLKLEASTDKNLKPSVVGLSTALENLAAKNYDATRMTKMFGEGNVTAALALVTAKDEYLKYTEVITGTNTALEQQQINNDNLAGSVKKLGNSWEGFVLSLNKSNGALKSAADAVATMFNAMTEAMKTAEQKQSDAVSISTKKQKAQLDKDVAYWQKYGMSKKEAIEKVLEMLPQNYEIPNTPKLEKEEQKLKDLERRYSSLKSKSVEINPLGLVGALNSAIMPTSPDMKVDVNPQTQPATMRIKEEIEAQRQLVSTLQMKNETYNQSIEYLDAELAATEKLNKETLVGKGEITDEDRKAWQKQDAKDKRELSFQDSIDRSGEKIRSQIYKIGQSADFTMPVIIKPEYEVSTETSDINGSIVDYQQRIQDVTLAYNEATTDGLRAMYAKQKEDLEKHLQEMTDVNEGMIDISNELNNLIQSGVVQGFESLGEAIGTGDVGEAMRGMLIGLMDMLKQFGAALVAAGIAKIAFDALMSNPYAAIAAGGALIIATTVAKASLSKVASAGSYAGGGIAPYYTVGDRMLANIDGGEMILNTGQQAKLFDLLDLGRTYVNNSDREISGRLVADGSSLVAVIDSHMKKQRRGK